MSVSVITAEHWKPPPDFAEIEDEFFPYAPTESTEDNTNQATLVAFSAARSTSLKGHKQKQYAVNYDHVFLNRVTNLVQKLEFLRLQYQAFMSLRFLVVHYPIKSYLCSL